MKKKLEAELISLAHRILQLKNKEDIAVLQEEARKLYEKLSVLRFVEENFSDAKPTIGKTGIEEKIESAFAKEVKEEKVVVGEIPSEEELESAEKVSELVGNLAAAKSVTDEPISEQDKAEVAAEEESEVQPEAETSVENPSEPEAETAQETQEEPAVESPTLEEGKEFVPAEASEELKFAQEANAATEMFWEAKPEEVPAAGTSDSELAKQTNTEAPADSKQDDIFEPKFELSFDDKPEETASAEKTEDAPSPTFTFDDLLGKDYADPVFVKPEELQQSIDTAKEAEAEDSASETLSEEQKEVIPISRTFDKTSVIPLNKDERGVTLNDKLSKGITIGLNDRIAFMKQLFNNSSEDYNRVLSQLITFDNFIDAKDFIDTMVKPDYDNWSGKEEYEQRFLEIIEKRFQ